jgi:hypothetical protein
VWHEQFGQKSTRVSVPSGSLWCVDGPDHEKDYVKEEDERKRKRLKRMRYRVIAVTDASQVSEVWETI